jgi:hypothetical protein
MTEQDYINEQDYLRYVARERALRFKELMEQARREDGMYGYSQSHC